MGLAAEQPAAEAIFALRRRHSGTPGATCPYCGTDAPDETFLQPDQPGPSGDVGLQELACDICSRPYGVYAVSLFCPDCGAPNLHVHWRRETKAIGHRVALAYQAQKTGKAESAMRTLAAAHEDAVTVLDACLMSIFRFLAKKRLFAAADVEELAAGGGFQDFARCREFFGQLGIDPFARVSPQDLEGMQRHFARPPAARRTIEPEEVEPLTAAETLRLVHISGEVIRYLEEWCSDFERMAAAHPLLPKRALRFTRLPQTAPSPESLEFERLGASCRETLAELSDCSRITDDIARSIEDARADAAPKPPPQPPEDLNLVRRCFQRLRLWGPAAAPKQIPATITTGRGMLRRTMRGWITNRSETGAIVTVEAGAYLDPGDTISLRWKVHAAGPEGDVWLPCDMRATVAERGDEAWDCYGVRFHRLLGERLKEMSSWLHKIVAATGAVFVATLIIYFKSFNVIWFWYSPFFKLYSLIASGFVFTRLFLSAFFYKEPHDAGYLPTLSVAIAAMNEENCIVPTVEHIYASLYPKELMEVIVVDDGSTDRTWERMQELLPRHPGIKLVRFEKNRGKRHAMAEGARRASGEVLVYVDSDSFVEPQAIYRIVQPFRDESIGAVAGHILVDVEPDNFISKMECVRYYVSHRLLKASESIFGAVTCCSGAFSAYRRETVMQVLDAWLNQKFLGVQATFGDDRSLTNYVLKTRRVIFHDGARALTKVPGRWLKYFKQQLRWKKSWSRETLVAARILWREHPIAAISYYAGVVLTLVSPLVVIHAMVYLPLAAGAHPLQYVGGLFLSYLLLSLICFYLTSTPYWLYGMTFALMYICLLSWQNYYAMFTVNQTKWGTR